MVIPTSVSVLYAVVLVTAATFVAVASAESCVQCNSAIDSRCAASPQHLVPEECTGNSTVFGCFSRIVDGHTIRGCLAQLAADECANSQLCNSCVNVNGLGGCNNQQYPDVRLYCHQCTGDLNSTCAQLQNDAPTLCNVFDADNTCFIRRTNHTIARGCLSSDNGGCRQREHCLICPAWGCNLHEFNNTEVPVAPSSGTAQYMTVWLVLGSMLMVAMLAQ